MSIGFGMGVTIEISDEQAARLTQQAEAEGISVPELLDRLIAAESAPSKGASAHRPVSAMIQEILGEVPPEELEKLPKDAASQIDHYIYGHPKR